jgi:hypothetical protein
MTPDLTGLQVFNPRPEIALVTIQGVIYIFAKPNDALLNPAGDAAAATTTAAVQ